MTLQERTSRILPDLTGSVISVGAASRAGRLFGAPPKRRAITPPAPHETDHERALRFISEGRLKEAAQLAARLINAGNAGPFLAPHLKGSSAIAARKWFSERADGGVEGAEFANITPEIAAVMLSHNDGNRQVKSPNLDAIMRDIQGGRWRTNGESMIISSDGRMNDGQHRCWGVVLVGRSITSVVSYGVERTSMATVDIGRKREGADRLTIAGVPNSTKASALAGHIFEMQYGRKPTPAEVDEFYHEHEDAIRTSISLVGGNIKGIGSAAPGAAAFYLMGIGHGEEKVRDFFTRIHTGEMMERRDPRMVLHKAAKVDRVRLSRENWTKAFVQHFIAHELGKRVSQPMYDITLSW